MPNFDWQGLLTQLSTTLLEADDLGDGNPIPQQVRSAEWLGYPGASEEQIAQAEERLGTKFPPSYRDFLQVSNGWRYLNDSIYHLWSAEEIEWFPTRNQEWIDSWLEGESEYGSPTVSDKDYFVYGEQQDPVHLRSEYLPKALEISDIGDDAILLLNPQIVTPQGEWEAYFFANWLPGAKRYPSFWELVQGEYQDFVESH